MPRAASTSREKARLERERQWLEREIEAARSLTDADRVRVLRDLLRTADAIRAAKGAVELEREEHVRRQLDREGKDRYRALVERLG